MLRNSTQKFKDKYHSSSKLLKTYSACKTEIFSSQASLQINSMIKLTKTRSTPKLQNSKSRLTITQPSLINKQKYYKSDILQTFCSSQKVQPQYIKKLIKSKQVQQSQVQSLRQGKLKRVNKKNIITRNVQDFIEKMPIDTVFFCCQCFHYVFQIEKGRHFPDCKDALNTKAANINEIGRKRLQKIVDLARYTGTKTNEIQNLYENFLHSNSKQLQSIQQPPICEFYTLQEIIYAYEFTYKKLLKNFKFEKGSFFDCY